MYCYRNLKTRNWHLTEKAKSSSNAQRYETVAMRDVTFKVSVKVRDWCVKNQIRQVHAFAAGEVCDTPAAGSGEMVAISYNPYNGAHFYRKDTGAEIAYCQYVVFNQNGAFAIGEIR